MDFFMEAFTASDSFIMKKMDQGAGITTKILQAIKNGQHLTEKDIEEQLLQIRRTRISPIFEKVLNAFADGEIVLIYSNVRIIQAIPFIVANVGGKTRGYIFVNGYGAFTTPRGATNAEKIFNINMKDLYALMEGTYVALEYYKKPEAFTKSIGLMRSTMAIYCNMFLRVLNKEYALSLSPLEYNQVCYCLARFYLENLWGLQNNEMSHSYAFGAILNPNRIDYIEVQDNWEMAHVKSLDELLKFLQEHFPRLRELSVRFFTEYYMNMYKATVVLGIDVLPYFLFGISSSLLGSFIANQPIIQDIARQTKGINYFYPELSRII